MATRKENTTIKATPQSSVQDGADDLAVLNPDSKVTIAGKTITVREYRFIEGLELRELYQPLLDDLQALMTTSKTSVAKVSGLLAKHHRILVPLMAVSADIEQAEVKALSDADGEKLMSVWWTVNCGFFLRRVVEQMMVQSQAQKVHDGQTSTKPLSSTTISQIASANTP